MDNNSMLEVINILKDSVNKTDEINKRLTNVVRTAIIAFSISFAVTVVSISWLYFNHDNTNGEINQHSNQNVNIN